MSRISGANYCGAKYGDSPYDSTDVMCTTCPFEKDCIVLYGDKNKDGKNLFQVLSYGSYCENGGLKYGNIEIEGIILLYASRDNPMQNYYFHYENFGKWRSLLKKYIMISDNMFDLSRKIFKAVKKGKEIDKKHIEKIAKYKLCSSVEEYESTYMDKYDVCPYVATCMSSTCKRLTKAIDNYALADEE
jgi:hypothetical protein